MKLEEIKQAFEKQIELSFKEGIEHPLLVYIIKRERMDMKNVMYDKLETLVPILDGFELEQDKEHLITPIFKRFGLSYEQQS
jgi:hypothetical protein